MQRELTQGKQDQLAEEEDKIRNLLTSDCRGDAVARRVVVDPRKSDKQKRVDVAPWMSNRQERVLVAPRKWYQNSRRMFFQNEESLQRRNGRVMSRRYHEVTPRRGDLEMRHHPSVSNLVFPRSFYPRQQGMIRLGGWHSPPVLDKVIQVRLSHQAWAGCFSLGIKHKMSSFAKAGKPSWSTIY